MKGGKDDEKNMSPMFPRLHVSDTEKGGPRAPPRNKMALYEQLSIPSQRFNSGPTSTVPAVRNNAAAPLVPMASLSQGIGHERTAFLPPHIPPTTADSDDNINSHTSDGVSLRTQVHRPEPQSTKLQNHRTSNTSVHLPSTAEYGSFPISNSKNQGNDNDFSVPTFVNSGNTPCSNKNQHNDERERLTPLSPMRPSRSTETSGNSAQKAASAACISSTHLHSARDKHLKRTNTTDLWSRQHVRNNSEENSIEYVMSKDYTERTASHQFPGEKTAEPPKHFYASPDQGYRSGPFDNLGGLHNKDKIGHLPQSYAAGFLAENNACSGFILPEAVPTMGKGNGLQARNAFPSSVSPRNDCNEHCEDEIHELLQATDVDRNDDASEASMVDSILGFDISPDDVVGVIGQKHFWKARRAIVNQQRLFQVQVFELHRLLKVQKLIAGSPHLLLEDTAYIAKPPVKVVPAKKQSDFLPKSSPQIVKQSIESPKPIQNTVCATENAVAKPSLTSLSGGVNTEQANQQTSHENLTPTPATDGNKPSWSFHPPPGNQWLVPVMSPSEGLVYKPYTGTCPPTAGFMTPMYGGGCGPMSVPSMSGEYPGPYGIPASHHQGMGVYPNGPPFSQPYFPPYGMPMMNSAMSASSVEHANPFAGSQSRGHTERISTGDVNFNINMQSRASHIISNKKSEAISYGLPKFQARKENEIQGSTASSPGERALKEVAGNASEERDALPLFPMVPAVQDPDGFNEPQNSDQQLRRVIKVVPHNPRSATESAARIFQSIQDERQQYDSV